MDWGLGNPNKTAVLIACLMMVSWIFADRRFRAWGFWVGLVLNAGLGVCLIHTYSRGGLVAVSGGLIVWWWLRGPAPLKEWIGLGIVVVFLAIYANLGFVEAGSRFVQGTGGEPDRSVTNRLVVWSAAPRMMIDAPSGWGVGNSGEAYTQFYQDRGSRFGYRTLVNSHLTRLVEFGWLGRFAYLIGWIVVLVFTWPARRSPAQAVPLACWIAFGIGGVFSTVDESLLLWLIPAVTLVGVVIFRHSPGGAGWPGWRRQLLGSLGAGGAILAGFAGIGLLSKQEIQIRGSAEVIQLGTDREGPPTVLLEPDSRVLGTHFGIAAREQLLTNPETGPITIVRKDAVDQIPKSARLIVLSGHVPKFDSAADWIALNPPDQQSLLNLKAAADRNPGKIYLGGFRTDPIASLLRQGRSPAWEIHEIPGKQFFLFNWLEVVYSSANPNSIQK